ncbi:hypothetical protein SAMN05444581_1394 [Methylocapsa palsarum]|uniref:Uncharacterized protein n=1 Tax=Methylocapsa palsarum TaxID=1612308 RepID=A0A1I4D7G5_9HYPH|nr:hypothetical protein SAMN05444581_1394 [Methylocapsa palsarum]
MARRKLKVFQTQFSFYDTVVSASSQAAALRVWGTHQNLFAGGDARIATDEAAVQAALKHPETPLRRVVGSKDPFQLVPASLPKEPDAPARSSARGGQSQTRRLIQRRIERRSRQLKRRSKSSMAIAHARKPIFDCAKTNWTPPRHPLRASTSRQGNWWRQPSLRPAKPIGKPAAGGDCFTPRKRPMRGSACSRRTTEKKTAALLPRAHKAPI